jgi:hypothetical protein
MCFRDFIDWKYIPSWLVFLTQLVNCWLHGQRNYTCVLLPLCLLSDLPPPLPKVNEQNIQWVAGGEGGGVLSCVVEHILQEFNTLFSDQIQNIATPPQTKMTNKDDIYGLVSLNFLRP